MGINEYPVGLHDHEMVEGELRLQASDGTVSLQWGWEITTIPAYLPVSNRPASYLLIDNARR